MAKKKSAKFKVIITNTISGQSFEDYAEFVGTSKNINPKEKHNGTFYKCSGGLYRQFLCPEFTLRIKTETL